MNVIIKYSEIKKNVKDVAECQTEGRCLPPLLAASPSPHYCYCIIVAIILIILIIFYSILIYFFISKIPTPGGSPPPPYIWSLYKHLQPGGIKLPLNLCEKFMRTPRYIWNNSFIEIPKLVH